MGDCDNWHAWYDQMPGGPARLIVSGECRFSGTAVVELRRLEPPPSTLDGGVIRAPLVVARAGPPPHFEVHSGTNPFFGVEVTTDPRLFNSANPEEERGAEKFYASYAKGSLSTGTSFTLPPEVWEKFKSEDVLAYRMLTSSVPNDWKNVVTTLPNAEALQAPVLLTGDMDLDRPADAQTLVLHRLVSFLGPSPTDGGAMLTLSPARYEGNHGTSFERVFILPDQVELEIARDVL